MLLITFDTTRFDYLSCYGSRTVSTPTIDGLAAEGVRYTRCYSVAPLTLPAHTSMLTGLYPISHGLHNNGVGPLNPEVVTLAELLSQAGYRTGAVIGAFVLHSRYGLAQGFATYEESGLIGREKTHRHAFSERNAEAVTNAALEWFDHQDDRPFFLWVHYFDPHQPYNPPGMAKDTPLERAYGLEIEYADRQLGRLLDRVRSRERASNRPTVMIFLADHGQALGDHGELTHALLLYNATIQVPLIVRDPTTDHPGGVVTAPVSVVDVFRYVLDRLGLDAPHPVHARPLPLSDANAIDTAKRPLYFETHMPYDTHRWSPLSGLVVDRWKYIFGPKPELYDVVADPRERNNVIAAEAERAAEYRSVLTHVRADRLGVPDLSGTAASEAEPQQLAALRGLGYVGTPTTPPEDVSGLPNPVEMVDVHNAGIQAMAAIDDGFLDEGVRWLTRTLTLDPDNRVGLYLLTDLLEERKPPDPVLELARRAMTHDLPEPFGLSLPLAFGHALARNGNHEEAMRILRACIEQAPESPQAHNALAVAQLAAGNVDEAESHARSALKLDEHFGPALETMGDVAVARKDYTTALNLYERSEANGHDPASLDLKMGDALAALGRLDEAVTRYRRAIEKKPELVEAHVGLGMVYSDRGQWPDAVRALRDAVAIQPDHTDAQYNLGFALLKTGDPAGAAEAFRAALRANPEHGRAAINLGIALFSAGDREGAIEALKQAAAIESAAPEAHVNLGVAYAKSGDVERAVQHYEQALRLKPDLEQPVNELVGRYLGIGKAAEAVRILRIAVQHHPNHVAYNNMLAMVLATSRNDAVRDGAEAVRFAQHADRLTGHQHPEVLATLAAAYAETGQYDRAVDTVQRAIEAARSANRTRLVEQLTAQQQRYRAGQPYRDPRF